jgi:hypothetical protein
VNVEQALRVATCVAKMKTETAHLGRELEAVEASITQRRMIINIEQILSALENSLRPLLPVDEDAG